VEVNRWSMLPDFPWDTLAPYVKKAREHPGGAIDLSVGTPVDPTPEVVVRALQAHANAPGYPTTIGIPELGESVLKWAHNVLNAPRGTAFLPTIGSKEIVAGLPNLLGFGPGDAIVIPEIAYPTYAVGVIATGANLTVTDFPESVEQPVSMVWLNSPSNPTGAVLSEDRLREIITWAQSNGVIVVSDECYFELGWDQAPTSILDVAVNGGDLTGLLAVHSLSKRSNMAGYRFGFIAGDAELTSRLLGIRKHLGMMVPTFVQHAAIAAYRDDREIITQRERYQARREILRSAFDAVGFDIRHSEAGLYLWATRGSDCWESVAELAELGIVATPGAFYGEKGVNFIRIALTATDADVAEAAHRLNS